MAVSTIAPRGLDRLSDEELLEIYHVERDPFAREELVKRFLSRSAMCTVASRSMTSSRSRRSAS